MTQPTELLAPANAIEELLAALVAHVEAENAVPVDLPEPTILIAFPTVL